MDVRTLRSSTLSALDFSISPERSYVAALALTRGRPSAADRRVQRLVGQRLHAAFTSTVSFNPAPRTWSWSASLTN